MQTPLEKPTITEKEPKLPFLAIFLVLLSILSFLLTIFFYGILLAKKTSLKSLNEKIATLDQKLTEPEFKMVKEEAQAFSRAVLNIQSILNKKEIWSKVFKELNNITPSDITYSSFSASDKGEVKLDGSAPTLSSVAKLLVALDQDKNDPTKKNPVFQNINLTSLSIAEGKVNFSISLSLTQKAKR